MNSYRIADLTELMLSQTLRPYDINLMENLLALLDKLIRRVPIYKMGCNISREAVETACRLFCH